MRRLLGLIVLVGVAPLAWGQARPVGPGAPAPAPATQPTTRPIGAKAVPASQLLDSLLKPPTAQGTALQRIQEGPAPDATSGKGAVAPGAPQVNLMREGSYIWDKTGRLTKGVDGTTAELTFDSDGKTLKDPPMVILPNLKLMEMENAVAGNSRDLRFKVTGAVTEYKGRNYILLEKAVVMPEVTQQF